MRIKAQGLLHAAKWVSDEYGRERLRDVLQACPPAVRERYTSAIPIDWHPVDELIDFVRAAERVLGAGRASGRVAEAIGAAGARANMKGIAVRLAVWMLRPEALVARAAAVWRQFNDEGSMDLIEAGENVGRFELKGVDVDPLFCALMIGWFREIAAGVGVVTPLVKHVECKARGGARCVWEVRYARIDPKGGGLPRE